MSRVHLLVRADDGKSWQAEAGTTNIEIVVPSNQDAAEFARFFGETLTGDDSKLALEVKRVLELFASTHQESGCSVLVEEGDALKDVEEAITEAQTKTGRAEERMVRVAYVGF